MAANPTPVNNSKLMACCHDLAAGCAALELEIGIKQNTAAKIRSDLEAAQEALREVGLLKSERSKCRKTMLDVDREGELVLGRCRLRLAALFGVGYNMRWAAAGFPDRSTMVPEVFAKRLTLLSYLEAYLTQNPGQESVDMGTTAAICHATHEALSDARSAVNQNKTELRTAVMAKNKALAALRQRMRGLIEELGIVLPEDDARWRMFGLNLPARGTMPQPVEKVTLMALGHGRVQVSWPAARHATRYRVQMRAMGAVEFEAVATVHEPNALLQNLAQGQFIEVRVIAANKVDETSPSPAASVAVM